MVTIGSARSGGNDESLARSQMLHQDAYVWLVLVSALDIC